MKAIKTFLLVRPNCLSFISQGLFILVIFVFSPHLLAQNTETPKGIGLEIGAGISDFTISSQTLNSRYSGLTLESRLLFPLLNSGLFNMSLEGIYKYTSLENNSNNLSVNEWAHFNHFGAGVRFSYSYLFVGYDYMLSKGENIISGPNSQFLEYDFHSQQWFAGLSIPLSPITSVIFAYSQLLDTQVDLQGQNLRLNEQCFWLKIQIDFGFSFLNLLKPSESFKATRGSFFIN